MSQSYQVQLHGSRSRAVWLARWAHNPKASGSNPFSAMYNIRCLKKIDSSLVNFHCNHHFYTFNI